MKKICICFLVIILLVGAFFLFSRGVNEKKTIKIGYLPIAASLPLFVAIDSGYFDNFDKEVELIPFQSSNQLALAGASNKIDLMVTAATNVVLDTSMATNKNFEAFMFNGYVDRSNIEENSTDYLSLIHI